MNGGCWRSRASRRPLCSSYSLLEMPPWGLSCCFALQHLAVQASLLCIFHLLLLPALPAGDQSRNWSEVLAQSLFACGVSTALQTSLGSRLPLVQAPSFEFLIPAMVLSRHAPATGRNGTAGPAECAGKGCAAPENQSLREVSGAVVMAGLVQLALGVSGTGGWIAQRCGPMVLAPSLSIIGLSAYQEAARFCSASWGVALLLVLLAVLCSQHLGACHLPLCTWTRAKGVAVETSIPALRMFSVLLPLCSAWIVWGIVSHLHGRWAPLGPATWQPPVANGTLHPPWLQVPYSGEQGWPSLSSRALGAGIAMGIAASMNSLGCYLLCSRALRVPAPPWHACNRGLCVEGLGSLLSGALGGASGMASSIPNACTTSLTQVGSRRAVQVSALACVLLGMSPRLAELLTSIPLAIHGGVLCVTYTVAVGTGISYFQYANIDSGRNIFIVGFTMFMALLVPRWLSAAPGHVATGTLEERGLLTELAAWDPGAEARAALQRQREASQVYGLPLALRKLLPPSGCQTFLLCSLCPGREAPGQALEEGSGPPGEATGLLLKLGALEAEADGRRRDAGNCRGDSEV
ncbi:solute carrier family 23 member 3 isoform X2 [Carettochelys insculpta]|uniref:solute carrier family 23 member 3 isoform X2 n=1 Tax=Carettochelys insculpta TaxID=44489 RepID=UPI003EBB247F